MSNDTEGFWDAIQTAIVRQGGTDGEWQSYRRTFPERVSPPCREPDDHDPPCPSCGIPVVNAALGPDEGLIRYRPCGHEHQMDGPVGFGFGFVDGVCRIRLQPAGRPE